MNVPDQLETRLEALAHSTGREVSVLLSEAIERYADEEEQFLQKMKEGVAAADRGEFVSNEEVRKWVYRRSHA